jgi:GH15 family glucan-1,4-alpha-glucosidase
LDRDKGGHWSIAPTTPHKISRSYIPETNVLQTCFEGTTGTVRLTDLMPVAEELYNPSVLVPTHEIIRQVEGLAGELELSITFAPRAAYGLQPVALKPRGALGLCMQCGRGVYWLRSSIPLKVTNGSAVARVTIRAGQTVRFSLSYSEEAPATLPSVDADVIAHRIALSVSWWQEWAKRAQYDGPHRDEVIRSALALKLMTYAPTGAMVAAPTTSLPERIGGNLNWDYRYCWLRDAALTVRAMLELGYSEEADAFITWLLQATRLTQPRLRVFYTVFGEKAPRERELPELDGYCGSRPVRTGNGARDQLQLDVYGEVIDAAAQYAFRGGYLDHEMQKVLMGFGNYVVDHWRLPDEGIWEPRTIRQNHTHSRLLCWTALDRLISLHEKGMLRNAPIERYKANAEAIRRQINDRCWNESLQSYVSCVDGAGLDASLLLLAWYGFDKPESPRIRSTYRAILEHLGTTNGLLYRYDSEHSEGAFALCSFWEAEYLALGGGSLAQALALFRRLLACRNDLGLYAEEIDPATGTALGNFPQAFTHIGLIGAALSIWQRQKGEEQLPHRPEEATQHAVPQETTA